MNGIARKSLALVCVVGGLMLSVGAYAGGADKVLVCHGTASATNPYVLITISQSAVQTHLDGHGQRNHPDMVYSSAYQTCEAQYAGQSELQGSGAEE